MGRKVGGPRLITHADGTEAPADEEGELLGDLAEIDAPIEPAHGFGE